MNYRTVSGGRRCRPPHPIGAARIEFRRESRATRPGGASRAFASMLVVLPLLFAPAIGRALVIIESRAGADSLLINSNDPGYNLDLILLTSDFAVASETRNLSRSASAAAGTGVLKAQAQSLGGGSIRARSSVYIDDVVFSYRDNASCRPSCAPQIPVSISSSFFGEFRPIGSARVARGSAEASFSMIVGNQLTGPGLRGSQVLRVDSATDGLGPFVETLGFSFFATPLELHILRMSLDVEAGGDDSITFGPSGLISDFGNSYELDPASVFDVPDDVLVTSLSAGIVNNQIPFLLPATQPAAVPAPPSLALIAIGLIGGMLWHRGVRPARTGSRNTT